MIAFGLACFIYKEKITPLQILAYSIIFLAVLVFNSNHIFAKKVKNVVAAKN